MGHHLSEHVALHMLGPKLRERTCEEDPSPPPLVDLSGGGLSIANCKGLEHIEITIKLHPPINATLFWGLILYYNTPSRVRRVSMGRRSGIKVSNNYFVLIVLTMHLI